MSRECGIQFLFADIAKSFHSGGYLLECLADLNENLKKKGGKLHVFRGCPLAVFRCLHAEFGLKKVCFEQDCEPIWHYRDEAVKSNCPYKLNFNPSGILNCKLNRHHFFKTTRSVECFKYWIHWACITHLMGPDENNWRQWRNASFDIWYVCCMHN